MNYLRPALLDLLARDYALGTLTGRARRRFEAVLRQQPAAAQAVAGWQRHFDVLTESVPRLRPQDTVWAAIEQRLFTQPATATPRPAWWRGLLPGRALGGVLAGLLLGVAVGVGVVQQQPAWLGLEVAQAGLPASYVGVLADSTGRATVLASSRRHGRELTVKLLQPLAVPPGRVAQLWALPADGSAPFPVAVVPGQGTAKIRLAASSEQLFFGVNRLAVSFEAAAAAAGSRPTGDFVVSGHCVRLW
jgi:anti-sigma-K factor RskA